jgi:transcriptional regulator with AAA-type ATPase domain
VVTGPRRPPDGTGPGDDRDDAPAGAPAGARAAGQSGPTAEQSWNRETRVPQSRPRPGAIKVFADGAACLVPIALDRGRAVVGRDPSCDIAVDDARMSRQHAELRFDGEAWRVADLGSRNGTFVDGQPAPRCSGPRAVLSVGDTLFLLCDDVRPWFGQSVEVAGGVVAGPTLLRAWREVERAARASTVLHVRGESGAGKELAARRFHDSGPRASGPLVPVNCAALPPTIAERLLFGTRRGAYSGADANAEGYLAAADGGTIFLDEVAELPLEVQAKLLRVVENRELVPLGAAHPRKIDLGVVTATHQDLRALAAAGRFRQDLYFRLGEPAVEVPALRERREDIAFLIEVALAQLAPPRRPHASLVEAALRRIWPGNVRELVRECAAAAGRADDAERVRAEHLDARAGCALEAAPRETDTGRIRDALAREHGNVTRAARALGMHRTQLRRWLAQHGPGTSLAPEPEPEPDNEEPEAPAAPAAPAAPRAMPEPHRRVRR